MKTVAITNHKGGTAKTTTAINFGAILAEQGFNVLLVDLDPQNSIGTYFGISDTVKNSFHLFTEKQLPSPIRIANMDILPASLDLATIEVELIQDRRGEYRLKELLSKVNGRYDYIIIDTAPSFGMLTINALVSADCVLIPVQSELLALKGLTKITELIDRVGTTYGNALRYCVLLTRYAPHKNIHREIYTAVSERFGKDYIGSIREGISVVEAGAFNLPITHYARKSIGAQNYTQAVNDFLIWSKENETR